MTRGRISAKRQNISRKKTKKKKTKEEEEGEGGGEKRGGGGGGGGGQGRKQQQPPEGTDLKNTVTENPNSTNGIESKMDEAEQRIDSWEINE